MFFTQLLRFARLDHQRSSDIGEELKVPQLERYCDVHAVGLMSQQKKNVLVGNGWPLNNVKAVFSTGSDPMLYNSDTGAKKEHDLLFSAWTEIGLVHNVYICL
jgi:hypothetical protein